MEMYSRHNERKSVDVGRFIRTLKTNIYKHITAVSKNVYIDKLDDTVNKFNNTYHRTIKMKPVDVKDIAYVATSKDINDLDPKFKVGDHARISKCKNIFVIKKVKNIVLWTYGINDFNGEETIGIFYEKELQKTNQQKFKSY